MLGGVGSTFALTPINPKETSCRGPREEGALPEAKDPARRVRQNLVSGFRVEGLGLFRAF